MHQLVVPISKKADLVITHDNQVAIAPGLLSDAQETVVIGPLNDETLEHISYALQRLRTHA